MRYALDFLEIVGFWHPDYLRDKLKKLQAAKLSNFIICVDRKYACGNSLDWQATGGHIFEFSKRINPAGILELISSPHPSLFKQSSNAKIPSSKELDAIFEFIS